MAASHSPFPKITVITPSFNQGQYIEQTIRSVLDQGYPFLEYLVLDGGSTDQTPEILRRYQGRLTFISESDRGQTHAINKGLAMATGDILCYLNSDDQLAPKALEKVGSFFLNHPECAWLTGRARIIDGDGREILKLITCYKNTWLLIHSPSVFAVLNYVSQPSTFWRRSLTDRIGIFDESLHYAMDYDYWLRLMQVEKLWVLQDYLALYRVHAESKGSTGAALHFSEELQVARRNIPVRGLLGLHAMHNRLILWVYKQIGAKSAPTKEALQDS